MLHLSTWEKDRSNSGVFVFVSMFKWKGKEKIHRWQAWKRNSSFSIRCAAIPAIFIYNFQKPNSRVAEHQREESLLVFFLAKGAITKWHRGNKAFFFFFSILCELRCIKQKPCRDPVLHLHSSQSIPKQMESKVYHISFLFMNKLFKSCLFRLVF